MSAEAEVQIPPKLIPVFLGEARYRGAYGGRGSAKTRTFAKMTAVRAYQWSMGGDDGLVVCGREFMNSLDESSMAEIKAAIRSEPFLADHFEVGEKFIRTRNRRMEYDFIGLHQNLDSIKSRALIKVLWVDEADKVSASAWGKVIPSVREHDSEVWVTWNPERRNSPTHKRFRVDPPAGARIIEMNYRDNPWFPKVLEGERLEDLAKRPESYDHVWEGGFATVVEGAYFAKDLTLARQEGRIGKVAGDPIIRKRAYWDIGGSSATADAMAIWIVQFVDREIRVLDYIEGVGQTLGYYVQELQSRGHGKALCILPHDGVNENNITGKRYEDHVSDAGFETEVVKNQGKGAAMMRVAAVRRLFPQIWFNETTTEAGRDALGAYHERKDEAREVGLGPEHDWASNGADAFGLMAVHYEKPRKKVERLEIPRFGAV